MCCFCLIQTELQFGGVSVLEFVENSMMFKVLNLANLLASWLTKHLISIQTDKQTTHLDAKQTC